MPQYQMPRLAQIFGGASAASPVSLVVPVSAPDLARYAGLHASRFLVEAPKRLEGAAADESYLFAIGQPQIRRQIQIPRPKPVVDIPPPIAEVFKVAQPELSRYERDRRFVTEGGCRVPIAQASAPVIQTDIFQPNQPEYARWTLRALRDVNTVQQGLGSTKQLTGAETDRASYLFPVNQPNTAAWTLLERARSLGGAPARIEGPLAAQTYEFVPNQPDLVAWSRPQASRGLGGPTLPSSGQAAQQTYVFVPHQPDQLRYARLQLTRGLGGSVAWPLDTFATIIVVSARTQSFTSYVGGSTHTSWFGRTDFTSREH